MSAAEQRSHRRLTDSGRNVGRSSWPGARRPFFCYAVRLGPATPTRHEQGQSQHRRERRIRRAAACAARVDQCAPRRGQDRLEPAGGPRQRPAQGGLAAIAGRGCGRAGQGRQGCDRGLLRGHRARPPSAGVRQRGFGAGAVAGGGSGRPDLARQRLSGGLQGAGADRRADPAHAGGYGGAPPLPQCAADHIHPACPAGGAGRERERYGRHDRDPLRRQRPAVRARRQHDQRRLPGAAVRHRRSVYRAAGQHAGRHAGARGAADHARHRGDGR